MPIYEYQCHECQQIFEEWQTSFKDQELECPVCGGVATKVLSHSTFVLKGGGWYSSGYCKTDSAAGKTGNSSPAGSGASASTSSDSSAKSSDSASS